MPEVLGPVLRENIARISDGGSVAIDEFLKFSELLTLHWDWNETSDAEWCLYRGRDEWVS
ncbi:hypothetical protein M569_17719 [Genlisea aurea]|uniref:Uncharacterized protein n=1 Tax=Genlisea aurea TaxID=192259 RepID=S8BY61_9LAMI|nr:hypothetical protein M569_17719 [Genlisea aurea]